MLLGVFLLMGDTVYKVRKKEKKTSFFTINEIQNSSTLSGALSYFKKYSSVQLHKTPPPKKGQKTQKQKFKKEIRN